MDLSLIIIHFLESQQTFLNIVKFFLILTSKFTEIFIYDSIILSLCTLEQLQLKFLNNRQFRFTAPDFLRIPNTSKSYIWFGFRNCFWFRLLSRNLRNFVFDKSNSEFQIFTRTIRTSSFIFDLNFGISLNSPVDLAIQRIFGFLSQFDFEIFQILIEYSKFSHCVSEFPNNWFSRNFDWLLRLRNLIRLRLGSCSFLFKIPTRFSGILKFGCHFWLRFRKFFKFSLWS